MKDTSIKHSFYLQIQRDIDRTDDKSDRYRRYYYLVRLGLIVIATIITILSGFKFQPIPSNSVILNTLLILGTFTTAITAIDTLFQIETKKNVYKLMLVELREIRSEIIFYNSKGEDILNERIDTHLFQKYQTIMAYSKNLLEKEKEPIKTVTPLNSQIHSENKPAITQ